MFSKKSRFLLILFSLLLLGQSLFGITDFNESPLIADLEAQYQSLSYGDYLFESYSNLSLFLDEHQLEWFNSEFDAFMSEFETVYFSDPQDFIEEFDETWLYSLAEKSQNMSQTDYRSTSLFIDLKNIHISEQTIRYQMVTCAYPNCGGPPLPPSFNPGWAIDIFQIIGYPLTALKLIMDSVVIEHSPQEITSLVRDYVIQYEKEILFELYVLSFYPGESFPCIYLQQLDYVITNQQNEPGIEVTFCIIAE